jgi:hypothetical protein
MPAGDQIRYRAGYKYHLKADYRVQLRFIRPTHDIESEFITLTYDGWLWIRHGYAWDGPSGPTWDTKDGMRGSLVHDALYQLMRDGWLSISDRQKADREFFIILLEDKMNPARATAWFSAVRICAAGQAKASGEKPLMFAP